VWRDRPLRWIVFTAGAINLAAAPSSALAPIFADAIFQRGARGLGFLTSAVGVGAVIGVLTLARRSAVSSLPKAVGQATLLMACALTAFAISPSYWVTLGVMPFIGMAIMRLNAGAQTLVQSTVEDSFRGRIMGIYSMMFLGLFPVGSLAAGALAEAIGARAATAIGGALCFAAALHFLARRASVEAWVRERAA
jgi:predicted MFS family arabinose efflux permease